MRKDEAMNQLYIRLCELKLEEKKVVKEIKFMLSGNNRIVFSKASKLNSIKTGIEQKIKSVEESMGSNIA